MNGPCARLAWAAALLTAAAGALPAAGDTFDDALRAYRNGNYAEAYRGFLGSAGEGDAVAQYNLGVMHYYGYGVDLDYAEATKRYRQAAEQGYAEAQYGLGVIYADGYWGAQDYAEAAKWFRRAAEQGHVKAQRGLGKIYAGGFGVPRDPAEAARWFRRAADLGDAKAQASLGLLYEGGLGVPKDYARAWIWLDRASARSPGDRRAREIAEQERDRIARLLSPEELRLAQRIASAWRPGGPPDGAR